jgi:hypothetical protein
MSFEETKKYIEDNYNIIEYNNGHIKLFGRYAGIYKNPYWTVKDNDNNNNDIMLMYCETNTVFKLCLVSYQKILDYETINDCKITWSKCKNGYIIGNNKLYIHQIITGCYGNGKGTNNISVDHIDQNPLNNSWNNLRIATREEQEQNSKGIKEGTKRERKQSAKSLPEGITQNMMKKYVVYYHEWLNKEKTRHREYFNIEKHPKLDKIWIGCKSNKVSIQEKLNQANKKVQDLDNDIYP